MTAHDNLALLKKKRESKAAQCGVIPIVLDLEVAMFADVEKAPRPARNKITRIVYAVPFLPWLEGVTRSGGRLPPFAPTAP